MKPSQLTAVILAGGFGTRIKHLLGDLPKPMWPVSGKPFLEWVVRYLARQGIREVIISTGYRADIVAKHFDSQSVKGVQTHCVPEETPLGTAGGFLQAAKHLAGPPAGWLVLNGDSLAITDISAGVARLSDLRIEGVIYGREVPDASRYGSLAVSADGQLLQFNEKKPGKGLISAGIYVLRHSLLEKFPKKLPLSFENDVFPALTAGNVPLKVEVMNGPFLDIGTPESLRLAEPFVQDNLPQFAEV